MSLIWMCIKEWCSEYQMFYLDDVWTMFSEQNVITSLEQILNIYQEQNVINKCVLWVF